MEDLEELNLVSIEYEDIDFVSEGVKITVTKSKTDQTGIGYD